MGHKISTIVSSFIILLVFMCLISFICTDMQAREAEKLVQSFTEDVRYKGYITLGQYNSLLTHLPYKNTKIQMTHIIADRDGTFGPGVLDMKFSKQIFGDANDLGDKIRGKSENGPINRGTLLCNSSGNNNMYRMEVGDQFQVDLIVLEGSFFDSVIQAITGADAPSMRVMASSSGVVLNEQY